MKSIGKAIKEIMKEKKISLNRMGRDLEIDPASLFRSLKEDGNPEWKRVTQILEYLNYEIYLEPKKRVKLKAPNPSSPEK